MGVGWGSKILFYRGPEGILQSFRIFWDSLEKLPVLQRRFFVSLLRSQDESRGAIAITPIHLHAPLE